jgi:O-acetylserine/cysteine efflux transporter
MQPSRPFGPLDVGVVVMMNLFWGLNIIAVKQSVLLVAPLAAAFLRQAIVLAVCAGSLRRVPGSMAAISALGLLLGVAFYIVINLSLALATNLGALAIAGQLGVPFALILAVLFQGERIHWPRLTGIALALGGVAVLVFDPAAAHEGPALALTALSSLIWAIGSLIQRRLRGVPVLTLYGWIALWGTIGLGGAAITFEPRAVAALPALPLSTLGWIAFSAIGSTLGGHGALAWLLQRHPVTTVTPFTLAAPVISVFTAAWYFGTPVTMIMLLGGTLAMAGVAIVTMRTAARSA